MLRWNHPEGLCRNLGAIAQTVHCNHCMAPDTKKANSRWPPGRRVMEKSILAIFAEAGTEAALSGFPLFQREHLCPAGWQDRMPHLCSWTTSIYSLTRKVCRRSGGNISSTKKGSRPRKKAAYFLALSKRGVGFNLNPKKLCYII